MRVRIVHIVCRPDVSGGHRGQWPKQESEWSRAKSGNTFGWRYLAPSGAARSSRGGEGSRASAEMRSERCELIEQAQWRRELSVRKVFLSLYTSFLTVLGLCQRHLYQIVWKTRTPSEENVASACDVHARRGAVRGNLR